MQRVALGRMATVGLRCNLQKPRRRYGVGSTYREYRNFLFVGLPLLTMITTNLKLAGMSKKKMDAQPNFRSIETKCYKDLLHI